MTDQNNITPPKEESASGHNLPFELVVSLTSYWKRLPWIRNTLDSLMAQSVKPDRILLWVANEDKDCVPENVQELNGNGIEINYCKDIGPYKKMIPTLSAFQEAAVITADDDLWYGRHWVRDLVQTWSSIAPHVESPEHYAVCHRAHGVTFDERRMRIQPYSEWEYEVEPTFVSGDYKAAATSATSRLFASSGTGIFIPPGPFRQTLLDRQDTFMQLAPFTDDISYFFTMGYAGMKTVLTPLQTACVPFYIPQDDPLQFLNNTSRNDQAVRVISKEMGLPDAFLKETVSFPKRNHTLSSITQGECTTRRCLLG